MCVGLDFLLVNETSKRLSNHTLERGVYLRGLSASNTMSNFFIPAHSVGLKALRKRGSDPGLDVPEDCDSHAALVEMERQLEQLRLCTHMDCLPALHKKPRR